MINFKDQIVDVFDGILNKDKQVMTREEIRKNIETPPDYKMGDFAFPVFALAKVFRKAPNMIAEEIAGQIQSASFERVETAGAYINLFTNKELLAKEVVAEIQAKGEDYGKPDLGKGRNVVLDFSSPNIAKPFHIGHIRSTVIGDSLEKIYKFLGFDTYGYNHIGDYGTQFGMLIHAIKKWDIAKAEIEEDPIPKLLELYVKINEIVEDDEDELAHCRDCFAKLENGDEEYVAMWEWIREVSLQEFNRVYELLDIGFYKFQGESFYTDYMPDQIKVLEESGTLIDVEGAKAVNLEAYDLPNPVVIKSNGSSMYMTRDIATAVYRHQTHAPYKNIYVVASQQRVYFQQLKAVLKEMGYDWYDEIEHVQFGMVSLADGTLSTRKGRVVYLEDVLNQAIDKVRDILDAREAERGTDIENKEELAKQVGIGAVKFQELFNQRIKDYVFDWETTLSFDGETGPYVQYSHARINSLLERGGFDPAKAYDTDLLKTEEEINLLRTLYGFTETVIEAGEKNEPYHITRYAVELAKGFNSYYNTSQILVEDEDLKNARLMLCYCVKTVIKQALGLLGIHAPSKM